MFHLLVAPVVLVDWEPVQVLVVLVVLVVPLVRRQ
tara:strand:+ start:41 stop:145 length:105 start_codon:yes stop_codon:yes gene_type:complete